MLAMLNAAETRELPDTCFAFSLPLGASYRIKYLHGIPLKISACPRENQRQWRNGLSPISSRIEPCSGQRDIQYSPCKFLPSTLLGFSVKMTLNMPPAVWV